MAGERKTGDRLALGREQPDARFPGAPAKSALPQDYADALGAIKQRIQEERLRVVLSANAAMVRLYWDIGRMILERQERAGWGAKVIDRLAADLGEAFPDMRGFSPRNLKYMRAFAAAWPDETFVQQAAARIPWFHNCLLDRIGDAATREWYIKATLEEGWSRSILALQIEGRANERQGKAITNFSDTLPPADSDLAGRRNGTLYIGVTSQLAGRVWQHKRATIDGFTKRYGVHTLVYYEVHPEMAAAIVREKQLKKWNRAWKLKLIEDRNPEWKDLWDEIV